MYSIYNRSIPISFQNTLYCGTEAKQNNTKPSEQTSVCQYHSNFYTAIILLLLLEYNAFSC